MKIDVIHSSNKIAKIFQAFFPRKINQIFIADASMPKCVQPPRERLPRMQV